MQNPSGWLQGIQYFRAIAILEVVTVHVTGAGIVVPNPLWIVVALRAFTWFGVSHFFFISGVVLYNKYNNGFSLSTFYKKRFSAVVPPYLVWSTLYFAYFYLVVQTVSTYVLRRATVPGSNQSVVALASTYLGQLTAGIQHLWFVVILIQLYLLYPLLEKMYNRTTRQNSPFYILSFLLLVQICYVALETAYPYPPQLLSVSLETAYPFQLIAVHRNFLPYVFYFVFGFFIAQHYQAIKQRVATFSLKSISLMVLASTIYYAVIFYHAEVSSPALPYYTWLNVVTGPFYCIFLIFFYLKISTMWGEPHGLFLRYLEKIGEDSFGIFLVHWFFVVMFTPVLFMLGLNAYDLILYPVLFFLTIISSYLAVEAIYHLPFSNVILGKQRKKQASVTQTSLTN